MGRFEDAVAEELEKKANSQKIGVPRIERVRLLRATFQTKPASDQFEQRNWRV